MPGGITVAMRVDRAGQLGRPDPGFSGQHRQDAGLGLDRVPDDQVQLGPIARGDGARLVHVGGAAQVAHELRCPRLGQRQPL